MGTPDLIVAAEVGIGYGEHDGERRPMLRLVGADGRETDVLFSPTLWYVVAAEMHSDAAGIPDIGKHLVAEHGYTPADTLGRTTVELARDHARLHPGTRREGRWAAG